MGLEKGGASFRFYAGAEVRARELAFRLEHFWLHEPGFTQKRLANILAARGINGVIIASHSRELGDKLQLDWEHLSAVKIDCFPLEPRLHNVTNNQCNIIRLAMRRLRVLGYRRLGFVVQLGWNQAVDNNWTAGYLTAQQDLAAADRLSAHVFLNYLWWPVGFTKLTLPYRPIPAISEMVEALPAGSSDRQGGSMQRMVPAKHANDTK